MKKLTAIFAAAVLAAGTAFSCGKSKKKTSRPDAASSVEEFAAATIDESKAEVYLSYLYPDEKIEKMKASGEWEKTVEEYRKALEALNAEYKLEIRNARKQYELSDAEVASAEKCFKANYGADVDFTEGWLFFINTDYREKATHSLEIQSTPICALYDGKEWKMIDSTPSTLVKNYP